MPYTRLTRKTAVSWIAGSVGTPIAIASYRVADVSLNTEGNMTLANNNYVGAFQPGPNRPGGRWGTLSFTSELRGSDTADTPPPEGALLRACGFRETNSGTTPSIVYTYTLADPHLTTGDPVGYLDQINFTVNEDRLDRDFTDAVGNVIFNFTAAQIPTMGFAFRMNAPVSAAAEGAADAYTVGSPPVPVQAEACTLTPSGSSAVANLVISSLIYDVGNFIDPRDDINGTYGYSDPIITGRNPAITLVVEAPLIATIDFEVLFRAQTDIDVAFTHNVGGGIREEVAVAFTGQISDQPVLSEMNGKFVYTIPMQQSIATGATPLTLTWAAS